MPTKEVVCFVPEQSPNSAQSLFQRDIDHLVYEIQENFRLKAKPSHISKGKTRVSPYSVPSRTDKCECCDSRKCIDKNTANNGSTDTSRRNSDDPYEMLQELLKGGDLIKEAVKRLQFRLEPKKKRIVYYESDEEF